MRTGKVKFWNEGKGYGFIIDDENSTEYYTYKKLLSTGQTRLINDAKVEYELKESDRGMQAHNVKPI